LILLAAVVFLAPDARRLVFVVGFVSRISDFDWDVGEGIAWAGMAD
jgi:hypothetical protein